MWKSHHFVDHFPSRGNHGVFIRFFHIFFMQKRWALTPRRNLGELLQPRRIGCVFDGCQWMQRTIGARWLLRVPWRIHGEIWDLWAQIIAGEVHMDPNGASHWKYSVYWLMGYTNLVILTCTTWFIGDSGLGDRDTHLPTSTTGWHVIIFLFFDL